MGKCQWRGYRGVGMSCIQGCADGRVETITIREEQATNIEVGETEVVTDTSVQDGKKVCRPGNYHGNWRRRESRADFFSHPGSILQRWSPVLLLRRLLAATFQEST